MNMAISSRINLISKILQIFADFVIPAGIAGIQVTGK
jgi:hypothetical protein